ncbi:CPBP family intramembrane glutamic endopeptidase [Parvimonas micra]|uniref:CPBP family intramembrane metalloprotease n=1 Tax=Parvimonas micra TaxID=33033 RepID=A0A9X3HFJ6_9FIRM|nr:CPBP family intramembrane glutamic endopeptidase [Parvimonas micra]MCZ7407848.1 CPBP family intramembrane metalloprotease [Parvimonas micra]MCZ7410480.1 CPBP family intramembrane metalloprotease [Parvimonas micra]MCZ7412322.1 CPBP family intramembrane metalloprotease [Parvimonas micra]WBB36584.1 CPBP family intramembrane metalloprotease [Parvimonas micra]
MAKIKRSIIIGFIVLYLVLMSGQMENLVAFINKGKMYSWGMDFLNAVRKYEISFYVIIIISSLFLRNVNSIEKNKEKFKINNLKKYILSILISLTLIIVFGIVLTKLLYHFKISGDSYGKTDYFAFQYNYLNYIFITLFSAYAEEIIYRGYFFGTLYDIFNGTDKYVRFFTASLVSGIIFGVLHEGLFDYRMIQYVFMSIVLSYQYKYCKNIYIVGFTHHCVNIVGMGINMFLLN